MTGSNSGNLGRAAVALSVVLLVVSAVFGVAKLLTTSLGLPASLDLPSWLRATGDPIAVAGLAMAAWVFRYRTPVDMAASTYVTFVKLLRMAPLS